MSFSLLLLLAGDTSIEDSPRRGIFVERETGICDNRVKDTGLLQNIHHYTKRRRGRQVTIGRRVVYITLYAQVGLSLHRMAGLNECVELALYVHRV